MDFYHEFDATASWNGYAYQGKLTVYFILKKILSKANALDELNDLSLSSLQCLLNDVKIEVEYSEDIAFLEKYEEWVYTHIYQVKAGATTTLSTSDSFNLYVIASRGQVINTLRGKERVFPRTYLFSSRKLQSEDSIKKNAFNHVDKIFREKIPENTEYFNKRESKATLRTFIKRACKTHNYQETVINPDFVIDNVLCPLIDIGKKFGSVTVHEYPEHFVDSEEILDACLELILDIKNILSQIVDLSEKNKVSVLNKKKEDYIFWSLVNLLEEDVLNKEKRTAYQKELSYFFEKLFQPIEKGVMVENIIHYIAKDILVNSVNGISEQFCKIKNSGNVTCPSNQSCSSCKINMNCNFYPFVEKIQNENNLEFHHRFLTRLAIKPVENYSKTNNFPSDDAFKNNFLSILKQYSTIVVDENHFYRVQTNDRKRITLELNDSTSISSLVKGVSKFVDKDPNFLPILFESSFLCHLQTPELAGKKIGNSREFFTHIEPQDTTYLELNDAHNRTISCAKTITIISKEDLGGLLG